jgi:hypothetical protein
VAGVAPPRHPRPPARELAELLADGQRWAATITPAEVLSQIGSPFAADPGPVVSEELDNAASTPWKHLAAHPEAWRLVALSDLLTIC